MQETINVKEIGITINTNSEEFTDKNIEKKLERAEKQIEEGKTIKATEVFKELEEKYEF